MTESRRPCLLDVSRHDRSEFRCEEPTFTQWLQRYSGQSRRSNTAATWVIADGSDRVVAYATLSMFAIDRSKAPRNLGKSAPDPVPALLIGRLAVDQAAAGLGLGTALVKHVLATAVELNLQSACRAVVVTASNDSAPALVAPTWLHVLRPGRPQQLRPLSTDGPRGRDLAVGFRDIKTAGSGTVLRAHAYGNVTGPSYIRTIGQVRLTFTGKIPSNFVMSSGCYKSQTNQVICNAASKAVTAGPSGLPAGE